MPPCCGSRRCRTGSRRSALADRTDLAIGFRQPTSVRRSAVGLTPWHDPSATPHIGQHESPGGRFGSGLGGVHDRPRSRRVWGQAVGPGEAGYGGPFGGGPGGYGELGAYWAFGALGAGRNGIRRPAADDPSGRCPARAAHPRDRRPGRADRFRRRAHRAGLRAASPARGGDLVAYEVLNLPEPRPTSTGRAAPTRAPGSTRPSTTSASPPRKFSAVAADDLTAVHRQDAATASPLARALVAMVPHDAVWPARLAELMAR